MKRNLHYLRKETRLIGRYTIKSVLGQGGFGITYLGMDELYQRKVAIKELRTAGNFNWRRSWRGLLRYGIRWLRITDF